MKPNKYYLIWINSPEHSKAAQSRLFELGVWWSDGGPVLKHTDQLNLWVQGSGSRMELCYLGGKSKEEPGDFIRERTSNTTILTLDDLYKPDCPLLKPQFISVMLNSTHTAHVYKDKVIVGCSTFPGHIIDALKQAHSQIMA